MKKALSLVSLLLTGLFLLSSCTQTPTPTPTPTLAPTPTPTSPFTPGLSLTELIMRAGSYPDAPIFSEGQRIVGWDKGTMNRILEAAPHRTVSELTPYRYKYVKSFTRALIVGSDFLGTSLYYRASFWANEDDWDMEMILPVQDDLVALVVRLAEEGFPDVLFCVYYHNASTDYELWYTTDDELWYTRNEFFFVPMTGPKSFADFADLQVGDSLEKLYEIDPSARYDRENLKMPPFATPASQETVTPSPTATTSSEKPKRLLTQFDKYLTDGILSIVFDLYTDTIYYINFFPSGENHVITGFAETASVKNYAGFSFHDASFLAPLFS
ncbi:MAG: hypothetical protein KIG36_06815 [Eubacteriales bacterium]|nr:hypothetical protein [Eubacteriales bacterium]